MEPSSVGWQAGGPASKKQRPLGSSQQSMRSFLSRPASKPQGPTVPCTTSQAHAACSTEQPSTSISHEPGPDPAAGGEPADVSHAALQPAGADPPAPAPAGQRPCYQAAAVAGTDSGHFWTLACLLVACWGAARAPAPPCFHLGCLTWRQAIGQLPFSQTGCWCIVQSTCPNASLAGTRTGESSHGSKLPLGMMVPLKMRPGPLQRQLTLVTDVQEIQANLTRPWAAASPCKRTQLRPGSVSRPACSPRSVLAMARTA